MKAYSILRYAEFENGDDDYVDITYFETLDKCREALKIAYADDITCRNGETIIKKRLNKNSYHVKFKSSNIKDGSCSITAKIIKNI